MVRGINRFACTCPASMSARPFLNYMRLPSDAVLTARVLGGLVCKLDTEKLRELVDVALDELDRRDGDPDMEPDVDCEPEPEMGRN